MISITINDDSLTMATTTSLNELLAQQQIDASSVALVLNGEVVPKSRWSQIYCQADDKLEIFSVVAGG